MAAVYWMWLMPSLSCLEEVHSLASEGQYETFKTNLGPSVLIQSLIITINIWQSDFITQIKRFDTSWLMNTFWRESNFDTLAELA